MEYFKSLTEDPSTKKLLSEEAENKRKIDSKEYLSIVKEYNITQNTVDLIKTYYKI